MVTIRLGQRISELVSFGEGLPVRHTGRVVYIHPRRRFATIEFELPGGRVREDYLFRAPEYAGPEEEKSHGGGIPRWARD